MPARLSFVCQQGRLEAQAILLAASLRRHLAADTLLIAAYPHRRGALAAATLAALKALNVHIVPIENPLSGDYLIGHKLAALALLDGGGPAAFLDSDILAIRAADLWPAGLCAVPASVQHCDLATWEHIYRSFSLVLPPDPPATLLSDERTAPYYNTGFIAIPGAEAARFAQMWIDCSRRIDADPAVPAAAKRPYLDQTSFPIAAALTALAIEPLEEKWNYRGWGWDLPEDADAIFFHYQDAVRLARQPRSAEAARAASRIAPEVEAALKDMPGL